VRTVYSVSSGDYSDYQVEALFETRELAEQYSAALSEKAQQHWRELHPEASMETIARWYPDERFIEEFDLYDSLPIVDES